MDTHDYLDIINPVSGALAPHNGLNGARDLAGTKQRIEWTENALSINVLVPLTGFVMRAWRESWPTANEAGMLVSSLNDVADFIHGLKVLAGEGAE